MVLPPQNRGKHLLLPFILLWLCWASTSEGFPPLFSLARRQLSSSSSPSPSSSTATINNNSDYNLLQESNKNNATFIHYCLTNQRVPICKDTLQVIHDYIESQSTLDLQVMNSINFLDKQESDGSIPINNGFDNEQEERNESSSFVQANHRLNRRQNKKVVVIDGISYCPCSSMNNSSSSISATGTSFSKTVAATGTVETCAAASTVFITSVPPVAGTTTRPYITTASNNDCKNTIASTATVTITNAVTLPASTVFPKDCNGITSHSGITPTSSQIAAPTSQTTGTGRVDSSCDNTMVQSTSTTTVTVTKSSASYVPKTCLITETMKTTLTEIAYGCPVSTTMISEIGTSILPPSSATNTKARPTSKNSRMSSDKTLATTSSEARRVSMTSNTSPSKALSTTKGNQLSSSSIRKTITTTPLSSRATSRATSRAATTKHLINSSSSASASVATTRTTNTVSGTSFLETGLSSSLSGTSTKITPSNRGTTRKSVTSISPSISTSVSQSTHALTKKTSMSHPSSISTNVSKNIGFSTTPSVTSSSISTNISKSIGFFTTPSVTSSSISTNASKKIGFNTTPSVISSSISTNISKSIGFFTTPSVTSSSISTNASKKIGFNTTPSVISSSISTNISKSIGFFTTPSVTSSSISKNISKSVGFFTTPSVILSSTNTIPDIGTISITTSPASSKGASQLTTRLPIKGTSEGYSSATPTEIISSTDTKIMTTSLLSTPRQFSSGKSTTTPTLISSMTKSSDSNSTIPSSLAVGDSSTGGTTSPQTNKDTGMTASSENTVIMVTSSHTPVTIIPLPTYAVSSDLITTTDTPKPLITSAKKINTPMAQVTQPQPLTACYQKEMGGSIYCVTKVDTAAPPKATIHHEQDHDKNKYPGNKKIYWDRWPKGHEEKNVNNHPWKYGGGKEDEQEDCEDEEDEWTKWEDEEEDEEDCEDEEDNEDEEEEEAEEDCEE